MKALNTAHWSFLFLSIVLSLLGHIADSTLLIEYAVFTEILSLVMYGIALTRHDYVRVRSGFAISKFFKNKTAQNAVPIAAFCVPLVLYGKNLPEGFRGHEFVMVSFIFLMSIPAGYGIGRILRCMKKEPDQDSD